MTNLTIAHDVVSVSSSSSYSVDGSGISSTNDALIVTAGATFKAEVYWEGSTAGDGTGYDGPQLEDQDGNVTFSAGWSTQFNRYPIVENNVRLRFKNVGSSSGTLIVTGDETGG